MGWCRTRFAESRDQEVVVSESKHNHLFLDGKHWQLCVLQPQKAAVCVVLIHLKWGDSSRLRSFQNLQMMHFASWTVMTAEQQVGNSRVAAVEA